MLELLPSPLPGLETPQQLQPLLAWAMQLTHSPRVRESDAGARLLRVLLIKYVLGLHWQLQLFPEPAVLAAPTHPAAAEASNSSSSSRKRTADIDALIQPVVTFLTSLTGQLRSQLSLAQSDIGAASTRGLVHGAVLALRYAVDELPWSMVASSNATVSGAVSATAAAAGAGRLQQQQQQQSAVGSSSDDGSIASAAAAAAGVVTVSGPAAAVLQVWMADLLALLVEAAQLAQPYLSAQVGISKYRLHMCIWRHT